MPLEPYDEASEIMVEGQQKSDEHLETEKEAISIEK